MSTQYLNKPESKMELISRS
uniref:Uncharacterized protein n=1 Tax=Rhizophora mucronata TaxID=61149 RepID=A0A2P2IP10_RHIMU